MINICEEVDGCRYCSNLQKVIDRLGGEKILRLEYESDYQGYVDIDVLLSDGTVMSYYYSYGSCSGCDSCDAEDWIENWRCWIFLCGNGMKVKVYARFWNRLKVLR